MVENRTKSNGENLFVDVVGEQGLGSAENSFKLSEYTYNDLILENEKNCRTTIAPQSVSHPSPPFSGVPNEVISESRTYNEEELQ